MSNADKSSAGKVVGEKETAVFLRLIDAANVQHLLPYGHLLYGRCEEGAIVLAYAMHEVCIRGESLMGIFQNIQELRLYELGVGDAITEVVVRHRDEAWPEPSETEDED